MKRKCIGGSPGQVELIQELQQGPHAWILQCTSGLDQPHRLFNLRVGVQLVADELLAGRSHQQILHTVVQIRVSTACMPRLAAHLRQTLY